MAINNEELKGIKAETIEVGSHDGYKDFAISEYCFSKKYFTKKKAIKWLNDHNRIHIPFRMID